MNLVIYTALFADPDLPLEEVGRFYPFAHVKNDVKYIAFTNREDLKSDFWDVQVVDVPDACLLYTSPSPRDRQKSRMPSSA